MDRVLRVAFSITAAVIIYMCVGSIGPKTIKASELAQTKIMQCMEKCIRTEGSSKTEICKSRCANLPSVFGKQIKRQDCMKVYKNCYKICAKRDKVCKKNCKQALMRCP